MVYCGKIESAFFNYMLPMAAIIAYHAKMAAIGRDLGSAKKNCAAEIYANAEAALGKTNKTDEKLKHVFPLSGAFLGGSITQSAALSGITYCRDFNPRTVIMVVDGQIVTKFNKKHYAVRPFLPGRCVVGRYYVGEKEDVECTDLTNIREIKKWQEDVIADRVSAYDVPDHGLCDVGDFEDSAADFINWTTNEYADAKKIAIFEIDNYLNLFDRARGIYIVLNVEPFPLAGFYMRPYTFRMRLLSPNARGRYTAAADCVASIADKWEEALLGIGAPGKEADDIDHVKNYMAILPVDYEDVREFHGAVKKFDLFTLPDGVANASAANA